MIDLTTVEVEIADYFQLMWFEVGSASLFGISSSTATPQPVAWRCRNMPASASSAYALSLGLFCSFSAKCDITFLSLQFRS